ncbi:MAG TPA: potassium channel protein [Jatrophihabitans sp.]|nr:potassium channel protein [Jatrophihabitans sp.]
MRRADGPAALAVRRFRIGLLALLAVLVLGTAGYALLGFGLLDAAYQTVTTVTTVGFREVRPLTAAGKVFTMVLILAGVGTALYTLSVVLEAVVEGHLTRHLEERRMTRDIARLREHVIICGWGRVGRACADHLAASGQTLVVVDRDPARLDGIPHACVAGDISDDDVLRAAGVPHARALVAALDTDADNVYVTLSARALNPDLVIIARARSEESTAKLVRAGADRVVNPQLIGGRRMAAFAVQPDVADFLDVVMHEASLELRIDQVPISGGAPLAGLTVGTADLAARTGVMLLALRSPGGGFVPNPPAGTVLAPGAVLIGVGTPDELAALRRLTALPVTAPAAAPRFPADRRSRSRRAQPGATGSSG